MHLSADENYCTVVFQFEGLNQDIVKVKHITNVIWQLSI